MPDNRDLTPSRDITRLIEVLVPRADYEILDTWHTMGLRGTGSHDVQMQDLFVPAEMVTEGSSKR